MFGHVFIMSSYDLVDIIQTHTTYDDMILSDRLYLVSWYETNRDMTWVSYVIYVSYDLQYLRHDQGSHVL